MSGHIYITGDVHGDNDRHKLASKKWPEGSKLDREDYLIVAGDMGILWSNDDSDRHEKHLMKWYSELKPWTTLFVDGNHENHRRLKALPTTPMFGGEVGVVAENIYHLKRGYIYTIAGSTFFVMGGATSWDIWHRLIDVSWWEDEIPTHQEFDFGLENMQNRGWNVDYIVTHTMPCTCMPMFGFDTTYKNGMKCPVTGYLEHIARNAEYKDWYFGHFHDDLDRGKFHLLYDRIVQVK